MFFHPNIILFRVLFCYILNIIGHTDHPDWRVFNTNHDLGSQMKLKFRNWTRIALKSIQKMYPDADLMILQPSKLQSVTGQVFIEVLEKLAKLAVKLQLSKDLDVPVENINQELVGKLKATGCEMEKEAGELDLRISELDSSIAAEKLKLAGKREHYSSLVADSKLLTEAEKEGLLSDDSVEKTIQGINEKLQQKVAIIEKNIEENEKFISALDCLEEILSRGRGYFTVLDAKMLDELYRKDEMLELSNKYKITLFNDSKLSLVGLLRLGLQSIENREVILNSISSQLEKRKDFDNIAQIIESQLKEMKGKEEELKTNVETWKERLEGCYEKWLDKNESDTMYHLPRVKIIVENNKPLLEFKKEKIADPSNASEFIERWTKSVDPLSTPDVSSPSLSDYNSSGGGTSNVWLGHKWMPDVMGDAELVHQRALLDRRKTIASPVAVKRQLRSSRGVNGGSLISSPSTSGSCTEERSHSTPEVRSGSCTEERSHSTPEVRRKSTNTLIANYLKLKNEIEINSSNNEYDDFNVSC